MGIIILSLAVLAMSIGTIFNRKPLSGSCGGLNQSGKCKICGDIAEECDNSPSIDSASI